MVKSRYLKQIKPYDLRRTKSEGITQQSTSQNQTIANFCPKDKKSGYRPPNVCDSRSFYKNSTYPDRPKTFLSRGCSVLLNRTASRYAARKQQKHCKQTPTEESSGRMREVWREKGPHPKGGPFSLQGLSPTPTPETFKKLLTKAGNCGIIRAEHVKNENASHAAREKGCV